jgi:hypothetical protein
LGVVSGVGDGIGRVTGAISDGVSGGLELSARALALPWLLGLRWAGAIRATGRGGMPEARRSAALALKIAADELFLATEMLSGALLLRGEDRRRLAREIAAAHALFARRGWLADPVSYHRSPPPLLSVDECSAPLGRLRFRHARFESGYAPHAGEPGRSRWSRYAANRTAHAWLLRHDAESRPWVVCVPGFRMGQPFVDATAFRVRWLHQRLGLNVAVFTLPFHGPRRVGRRSGDGYLSGNFVDTLHAQAQAVWDLRRLVGWLRREGAPAIGVHGISLGAYTAALLAALEPDLDAVVAGIPASCFVGLARQHVPPGVATLLDRSGFPLERIEEVMRVVSPLAMPVRVPRERRFVYAGTADRLAPPEQAWNLWRHWERPHVTWYHGSHVSFLVEPSVRSLLQDALGALGDGPALRAERDRPARPLRRTVPARTNWRTVPD